MDFLIKDWQKDLISPICLLVSAKNKTLNISLILTMQDIIMRIFCLDFKESKSKLSIFFKSSYTSQFSLLKFLSVAMSSSVYRPSNSHIQTWVFWKSRWSTGQGQIMHSKLCKRTCLEGTEWSGEDMVWLLSYYPSNQSVVHRLAFLLLGQPV